MLPCSPLFVSFLAPPNKKHGTDRSPSGGLRVPDPGHIHGSLGGKCFRDLRLCHGPGPSDGKCTCGRSQESDMVRVQLCPGWLGFSCARVRVLSGDPGHLHGWFNLSGFGVSAAAAAGRGVVSPTRCHGAHFSGICLFPWPRLLFGNLGYVVDERTGRCGTVDVLCVRCC